MYIQTTYRPEEVIDYLEEWFIHHMNIGVTHFYMYDNAGGNYKIEKSNWVRPYWPPKGFNKHRWKHRYTIEEAREKQAKLFEKYPVTRIEWQPKDENGHVLFNQIDALYHFGTIVKKGLCAFIDADEYIIKKEEFKPGYMFQKKFRSQNYYNSVTDCHEFYDIDTEWIAPKVILDMGKFDRLFIKHKLRIDSTHFYSIKEKKHLPLSKNYFNHYHTKDNYGKNITTFKYIKNTGLVITDDQKQRFNLQ
jgi:hypothetical protein